MSRNILNKHCVRHLYEGHHKTLMKNLKQYTYKEKHIQYFWKKNDKDVNFTHNLYIE